MVHVYVSMSSCRGARSICTHLLMRSQPGLPATAAPLVLCGQLPLHGPQLLMPPQPVQHSAME